MIRRTGYILGSVLLIALSAVCAYWLIFSTFMVYDDEGYVLLSLKNYLTQGRLYDSVYTQYGPFYFEVMATIHRLLHLEVSYTHGRWITLAVWLATSVACAGMVWQLTRSTLWTYFTGVTTFLYLWQLVAESLHPGGLIVLVLAGSLFLAGRFIHKERFDKAAWVLGIAAGALFLTKINVGVFYFTGVSVWFLLSVKTPFAPRLLKAIAVLLLLFMVRFLMNALWQESWIKIFFLLFSTTAICLFAGVESSPSVGTPLLCSRNFLIGLSLTAMVTLVIALLSGSSIGGLIEGVLTGPLRHPGIYHFAIPFDTGTLCSVFLSFFSLCIFLWLRKHQPGSAEMVVVSIRVLLLAGLALSYFEFTHLVTIHWIFCYAVPFIWCWVINPSAEATHSALRSFKFLVACVLLPQLLHAYPVAGSQISWSSFLYIPLMGLALGDPVNIPGQRLAKWAGAGALIWASAYEMQLYLKTGYDHFTQGQPLNLPKAENIRVPRSLASDYQTLAVNAVAHADVLFSLPGMFGFNLWTDIPTPDLNNATHWFSLLDDVKQRKIISKMESSPRCCIVIQRDLLRFLGKQKIPVTGPLYEYVTNNYMVAFSVGSFDFLTVKGRQIAAINTGRIFQRKPGDQSSPYDTCVDLVLALDGTSVSSIDVGNLADATPAPLRLVSQNCLVQSASIDSSGNLRSGFKEASWPLQMSGLVRILLYFNRGYYPVLPQKTVLDLEDATGAQIAEVRAVD